MKLIFAIAASLIFLTHTAWAQCIGTDLRPTLTPQENAELSQRISAMPHAVGNHWTATRGDKTIHLIGTIHMSDPRLLPILDRLKPVISSADMLLVEMTQDEQERLQRSVVDRPELMFLTTGPTLPELMNDAAWEELVAAAEARGIPGFMAAKFQPWYLSLTLSMPGCALRLAQSGAKGMDHLIMDVAAENNVPQLSLEPYDTLFTLMGQEPLDVQIEYLQLGTLPDDVATNSMTTMFAGYFEEQTAQIMEFGRILARRHVSMSATELDALIDEMYAALLDQRNKAWIPVILNTEGSTIVLAAGAGHLPGENGLLRLLENEGFTLERQRF